MRIVIVDYGMGNVRSIISALNFLGVEDVVVGCDFDTLFSSDKIILPGVGSFGKAITQIKEKRIDIYLNKIVKEEKKPILGICLGMQLLGSSSTEDGTHKGLSFVKGNVSKFDNSIVKVPHVGFNQVKINNSHRLYRGFNSDLIDFYFTHSYRMMTDVDINQCNCDYQEDFVASFEKDNIAGVQFHPELSQNNGLRVLSNFLNLF